MSSHALRLSSRVTFREQGDGFRVEIKSNKQIWFLIFMPAFLVMWTLAGIGVAFSLLSGNGSAGVLLWLVMWAVAEGFICYAVAWALFGKEIVELGDGVLTIRRVTLGLGPTRSYEADEVQDIRPAGYFGSFGAFSWSWNLAYWGLTGGTVAFDYRGKTERFGIQLEEREARELVRAIQGYFSQ